MTRAVFDLLKSRIADPLVLIDVGARWGAMDPWLYFEDKARIYCFEADPEEARRLNNENANPNIEYVPLGLSDGAETLTLNITAGIGCSSVYKPLPALYERYPGCRIMTPARTILCPATTLDAFLAERGIGAVHGIKLDTQGSELDILKGAESALKGCEFLIVEVEFNPLYEGQPLFCDVDRFLRDRGFCLWRLNHLAHYSTGILEGIHHHVAMAVDPGGYQHIPIENGQLFWSDAIYIKARSAPTSSEIIELNAGIAAAVLASQWLFPDLVLEIIRKTGDADLFRQVSELLPPGPYLATLPFQIEYLKGELAKAQAEIARLKASR